MSGSTAEHELRTRILLLLSKGTFYYRRSNIKAERESPSRVPWILSATGFLFFIHNYYCTLNMQFGEAFNHIKEM